jgi:hypothetical protein
MPWLGWVVAGVLLLGVGGTAVAGGLAGGDPAVPDEQQARAAGMAAAGGPGLAGPAHVGHRGHRGRWGARGPVRGELTVPRADGSFEQVVFARGEVTAISATSLSIRSADGTVTTFTLDGDTRYRRGRDQVERGDVTGGAQALAVGPRDGQTITARRVLLRPEARQPARPPAPSPSPTPTT